MFLEHAEALTYIRFGGIVFIEDLISPVKAEPFARRGRKVPGL